ncbi:MAG TPA: type II secretion system F family protein [Candidatus Paceibacterota bacterium]|nr:type II secretion system F family protein [Candidatus Paceibacterota bacterium]HMP19166.1 type II secretion system F family protein [Candidatus Paceibacterota bacterium]HMP85217.1 type II secretion system F family protein [Candidatus Paceibacterota bacterium]
MSLFFYKAIDQDGNQKEGTITAVNVNVAISSLQKRGFIISDIKSEEDQGGILNKKFTFFERVKMRDLVILSRQMSTLFEAQVSALRIFRLLSSESENKKLARALAAIAEDLQGGSAISAALSKYPDIFSGFYISMVKAGEESGRLDETFQFLADYLDRTYEVTSKARNALIYPSFIVMTFFVVMGLMLTLVIPKISAILVESGQDIPSYTKVVIGFSNFLVDYGVFILLALIVGGYFLYRFIQTGPGKEAFDEFKLGVPYVGSLYSKLYLARISDNLNTMLSSGIPMVKSLELTQDVVDNEIFKIAISKGVEDVKGGISLSNAFGKHEIFPGIIIQLIKVGEETGNLGEILGTLAKFYQREVTNAVDTLVGLIEPIMIVLLAVGVGFLLASVLIPIYNISATF